MKVQISYFFAVAAVCGALQASEHFKGYDVDQPQIRKPSTQQALEYERAQNANMRTRAAGFYNKLKGMLGFQPSVQQRSRVKDTQGSVAVNEFAKPVSDIEIVKEENYYADEFGIKQLLAKAAGKRIGDITYSPSQCRINHLEVDPEQRKKGAGSKLFKSAVDQMKDCEEIRWWATPSSVSFYRKQGGQREDYLERGMYRDMILDRTGGRARIKRNFLDRPL